MLVKDRMTVDPYTINYDAPVSDVISLMGEKDLKRIPVVNGDKVVGIITKSDIQKVSPSMATTLSIYEMNYLLVKTRVKDVMNKDVKTISKEALLEEAAVLMRTNHLSTLVVTENEKIVGLITESIILDTFIEVMGFRQRGTRISFEANDVPGILEDIGGIFRKHNINITHIADFVSEDKKAEVIVRTDSMDTDEIQEELKNKGYIINSVMKNEI